MPLDIVKQVKDCFIGEVSWLNVMGGELTLLPNYSELLSELIFAPMRIVTNGSWALEAETQDKFLLTVRELSQESSNPIMVSISRDRMHPKGVGEKAYSWMESQRTNSDRWLISTTQDLKEEERAIAPVGRAFFNQLGDGMLRLFGTYCRCHENERSMAVLEDGVVTYCPFGAWPMGYLNEGFKDLREAHERMDKVFIGSCTSCWQNWEYVGKHRWNKDIGKYDLAE
jgi:hypothetical protein